MKLVYHHPNQKQRAAAALVLEYLRNNHLQVDDDNETRPDGTILISTSERESAGDDEPSEVLQEQMREHAKKVCQLSTLIHPAMELVDEWVCLNFYVRKTPFRPRPGNGGCILAKKVLKGLPQDLLKHPLVKHVVTGGYSRDYDGVVEFWLHLENEYGESRKVRLRWALRGDTISGWTLQVRWGTERPLADNEIQVPLPPRIKKLTSERVLKAFSKLLEQMDDPMNCQGWKIHAIKDGEVVKRQKGSTRMYYRETFQEYQTIDAQRRAKAPYDGITAVMFVCEQTGHEIVVPVGQPIPDRVFPVKILPEANKA